MSTTEIGQKLFDYIRVADDRKVRAIYTMIEAEIQDDRDIWTDEFLVELNKRTVELENGAVEGSSWEEVKARARKFARDKHP
jgi:nitric oxide synthase oxygenase domain/subunit